MAMNDLKRIVSSILKTLECPICLELLNNPVSTSCNHRFCKNCIITALNEKFKIPCPLCKSKVTKRQLQDVSQLSEVISVVKRLVQTVHEDIKNEEENLNKCIIPPSRKENDSPELFNLSKRKRLKDQSEDKMNKIPKITHNKKRNLNDKIFIENESNNSNIEPKISTNANIRNALKRITRRTNSFTMEKYFDQNLKKLNLETGSKNNQNDKPLRTPHCKENVYFNYSPSSTRNKKEQIKNTSLRHTLPKRKCSKKILHEDSSSPCFPEVIFKRNNKQTKLSKIKSNSKANENSIENQDTENENDASFNLNKSITYSQRQMKIFKTKNVLLDSANDSQSKIETIEDPYTFIASQNSPKIQKKKKRKSKNFIQAQIKPVFQKLDEDSSNVLNNKSIGSDEFSSCNSSITEDTSNCKNLSELNTHNQTAINIIDENSNKNEDCDLFLTPALNIKQLKNKKKNSYENTSTIETRSAKKRKRNMKDETFFTTTKENISDWIEEISKAENFNLCINSNENMENKSLNIQDNQQKLSEKEQDNAVIPSTINETQEHINNENLDHFELVKENINNSLLEKEGSKQLENDKTEQLIDFSTQEHSIHINSQAISIVPKIETSVSKINNEISSSFQKIKQSMDLKTDTNDNDKILVHDELPSLENSLLQKSSNSSNTGKNYKSLERELNNREYINKNNIEINTIEENKNTDKSDHFSSHKYENIKTKHTEISTIDVQKIPSAIPDKIIIEESFPLSVIPNTLLSTTSIDQQSMERKEQFINTDINKQIDKQNNFTDINSVNDCNITDISICDLNNTVKTNDDESQSEKGLYDQDLNYKKPKRKTFCLEIETQDLNDLAEHRNTLDLLTEVCMEFANSSNKSDKSNKQNLSHKTLDKLNEFDSNSKLTQETDYLGKNSYQKHESQDEKFGSGNLSDQLLNSNNKNACEDKVCELHNESQIQDNNKHYSNLMPLSLECVKSNISKIENDQTVDISIPINIITETTEVEIKNIISFNCSECQCKIDLKKTEHNLIISFIKSSKNVYKTSDKSVGTENTIDNLNENIQIDTSTDLDDLANLNKKIPENESIENKKCCSIIHDTIEFDKEQIQNNLDNNSKISSQTVSIDLDIKRNTPENFSLEKTCDENEIDKERIYNNQDNNSKIFSQVIENNLINLNNEIPQTVPIEEENETHKEESCSIIDKFQNGTSLENSEDLLAELHQEISETILLKENCNANEDDKENCNINEDKENFQNSNNKSQINVSITNLDCNELGKEISENVLLKEKSDGNKIDNFNNSKISSEIIKVNDEVSETFIHSNQEEPLLFSTMISTKSINYSENSQNELSDTKLDSHKTKNLFTEEEILCENKKVIDDKINQETPDEINHIFCQKNDEVNFPNKNLEKFLKEMSCSSSDPDMIFAESLVAPLKNLQYSTQNQSSSEINSNKQIHQFDVNLSVSKSKNEMVQTMKKNKIAEIINLDDNCSSKTLNDAKKVENKINDSSKKESFSSKITSHLSNSLTLKNKFNAVNDTEIENTLCSEKSSKRRKNFQRIKNYLSESDSESSSEDLQDITENNKCNDDMKSISQKNQNLSPPSRKQQTETPLRKKCKKRSEVNQVSPIIYSVDTESAEFIHQSEIQEKIRLEIQQMKEQIRQMEIQLQTSVCEDANKSFNQYSEEEPHNVDSDSEEGSDELFSPIPPTP